MSMSSHMYSVLMKLGPDAFISHMVSLRGTRWLSPTCRTLCPHAPQHYCPLHPGGTCFYASSDSLVLLGLEKRFKETKVHKTKKAAITLTAIESSSPIYHVVLPLIGMGRVDARGTYQWFKHCCVWPCHIFIISDYYKQPFHTLPYCSASLSHENLLNISEFIDK